MTGKTILFVCTGNTCRSPMAEYLFRARLGPESDWRAESAGVAAVAGRSASPEAVEALRERGIDLTPHRSRPLTQALAESAALIIAMTEGHAQEIRDRFPAVRDRVRLLTSFGVVPQEPDIPDPIGQSLFTYRHVRDQIESALADLILYLREAKTALPTAPTAKESALKIAIGADHGGYELKEIISRCSPRGDSRSRMSAVRARNRWTIPTMRPRSPAGSPTAARNKASSSARPASG